MNSRAEILATLSERMALMRKIGRSGLESASQSPAYQPAHWIVTPGRRQIFSSRYLITGPDEPLSPEKSWSSARVLTALRSEVGAFASNHFDVRPAVGYISKGDIMHVGVLPEGVTFGNLPTPDMSGTSDPDILTVAIRQGPDPMKLFMGLVIARQGLVFIPASMDIARDADGSMLLVPEMDVPDRFPGTPLV